MFTENNRTHHSQNGWIEVIVGSMFSGKTEELIRRLRRARIAGQKVEIFKPAMENRYSDEHIVSHDDNSISSSSVDSAINIPKLSSDVKVIGIDEAQFFDEALVDVCKQLANKGFRVIVAGLDMDFKGKPFGPMPALLATAEYITKVHAICVQCGNLAHYSHRKSDEEKTVILGATELYEPLCRNCYQQVRHEQ